MTVLRPAPDGLADRIHDALSNSGALDPDTLCELADLLVEISREAYTVDDERRTLRTQPTDR